MTQASATSPVILLDLDRMLFDTDRFARDLSRVLHARFNIPPDTYLRTYPDFYVYRGEMRFNDFFRHMRELGLEPDAVEQALLTDLATNDYLYDDVPAFLQHDCLAQTEQLVLTHGEHRFQHLKYKLCPPLQALGYEDVLTHKREFIAERFAGRHGVLIDDHKVGALPPGFKHVWLSRYGADGAYHGLLEVAGDWSRLLADAADTQL